MTEKHSPLPWAHRTGLENEIITDADEDIICRMPNHPENCKLWHLDAPLIVRSVNGLPEAIAALERMVLTFQPFTSRPVGAPNSLARLEQDEQKAAYHAARAALTKLKG